VVCVVCSVCSSVVCSFTFTKYIHAYTHPHTHTNIYTHTGALLRRSSKNPLCGWQGQSRCSVGPGRLEEHRARHRPLCIHAPPLRVLGRGGVALVGAGGENAPRGRVEDREHAQQRRELEPRVQGERDLRTCVCVYECVFVCVCV
jgi:hypothetical protein